MHTYTGTAQQQLQPHLTLLAVSLSSEGGWKAPLSLSVQPKAPPSAPHQETE